MSGNNEMSSHSLDIYIAYHRLTARSLGETLLALGLIANDSIKYFAEAVSIGTKNLPTLEIDTVLTGDSIKIKFGEGWMPSITTDKENDIVINVPKKIGIPLLVGYLILQGVRLNISTYNELLDTRIKKMELALKQSELQKIKENREQWDALIKNASGVVNAIYQNPDYIKYMVSDIDIIKIRNEGQCPDNHKNNR